MEPEFFLYPVLLALQDFLCHQTEGVTLLDADGESSCDASAVSQSPSDRETTNPENSIAYDGTLQDLNDITHVSLTFSDVSVKDQEEVVDDLTIQWSRWEVNYTVVGEQTGLTNLAVEEYRQEDLQTTLGLRIQDETMDDYLQFHFDSSRPSISLYGDEVTRFQPRVVDMLDEVDFSDGARILRYVGILLLFVGILATTIIAIFARRHRLSRGINHLYADEDVSSNDENNGAAIPGSIRLSLVTEAAVNEMLLLGRRESSKAMEGKSEFLKPASDDTKSGELSQRTRSSLF